MSTAARTTAARCPVRSPGPRPAPHPTTTAVAAARIPPPRPDPVPKAPLPPAHPCSRQGDCGGGRVAGHPTGMAGGRRMFGIRGAVKGTLGRQQDVLAPAHPRPPPSPSPHRTHAERVKLHGRDEPVWLYAIVAGHRAPSVPPPAPPRAGAMRTRARRSAPQFRSEDRQLRPSLAGPGHGSDRPPSPSARTRLRSAWCRTTRHVVTDAGGSNPEYNGTRSLGQCWESPSPLPSRRGTLNGAKARSRRCGRFVIWCPKRPANLLRAASIRSGPQQSLPHPPRPPCPCPSLSLIRRLTSQARHTWQSESPAGTGPGVSRELRSGRRRR